MSETEPDWTTLIPELPDWNEGRGIDPEVMDWRHGQL